MNVWWTNGGKGRWDHGTLLHSLQGMGCVDYLQAPPTDDGVIAVLSHKQNKEDIEKLKEYPWVLAIHTSDESHEWEAEPIWGNRVKLWMQYPDEQHQGDRNILIGCQQDTQELVPTRIPLKDRRLDWAFSGQVNHPKRAEMVDNLRGNGELHIAAGFNQGVARKDHLRLLTEARIAPCPGGSVSPDSFRLYEAIEAGCLPVCDCPDFWSWMNVPVRAVWNWNGFNSILAEYSDSNLLQHDANSIRAWWLGYQRQYGTNLLDDVAELSGEKQPENPITVLMPTSPIKDHPELTHIENAITRIRAYPALADSEIIVMIDGADQTRQYEGYNQNYEEYKRRLLDKISYEWKNVVPLVFDGHLHQSGMTRVALEMVRTPFVFFVEHDTYPVGDIAFGKILTALQSEGVNSIRLYHYEQVPPEHLYMFGEVRDVAGLPLCNTYQFSARPHVAKTEWYKGIIRDYCDRNDFIEEIMHPLCKKEGWTTWNRFGMFVYAPNGNMIRSGHTYG